MVTVVVGGASTAAIFALGLATVPAGFVVAGAGLGESAGTGGAGVLVTVEALHVGAEGASVGLLLVASSFLLANESLGKSDRMRRRAVMMPEPRTEGRLLIPRLR